jgi:predicted MFS family arabinose efflux permease
MREKYATLLGLYIAQSIPMSFFSTILPVVARQENYSLETIGLLQLVKLPWILKFLWAPLVDRSCRGAGDYKRWITGSELFYAAALLLASFLDLQANFHAVILLVLVALVASATQDIATDALAILTLHARQRGPGNAVQAAGGFVGTLVGSGVLLLAYNRVGWHPLLAALAVLVLVALVPLRRFRCPPVAARPAVVDRAGILSFFTRPGAGWQVAFLLLFTSGIAGTLVMLKPYLVDLGYSTARVGFMSGIAGTATAVAAAVAAGLLVKRHGTRRCLRWFPVAIVVTPLYFLWMDDGHTTLPLVQAGICLLWATHGAASVLVFTIAMDNARPGSEGTDFTLQTVLAQLGILATGVPASLLAGRWGYDALFVAGGVMAVASWLFILLIYNRKS